MKIGLFFGSFNPVHTGHMIIANHLVHYTDMDEVWMVVSPQNPLKSKASLANNNDRYHLLQLAIDDNHKLRASNIEFWVAIIWLPLINGKIIICYLSITTSTFIIGLGMIWVSMLKILVCKYLIMYRCWISPLPLYAKL